ncbi:hypothetical protein [Symbiopectobacterium purcellii]|uniref:hypothetical protein n=1 Tax=Symbiopectobacterium purcellii TaxID=2871826 RepID=UPI003F82C337
MSLIPNANNRYSLLTDPVSTTRHADKKSDNNLIKQLSRVKSSADKTISISNKAGNMEIDIHYPKKRDCKIICVNGILRKTFKG